MPGKFSIGISVAAATVALAVAAPAAPAQPAAPAGVRVSCPITGGEQSGLRNVKAEFFNRSVKVTATVIDDQTGSTRAHFRAIKGNEVLDEALSNWIDDSRTPVTVTLEADRRGGADRIEYWTESTSAWRDSTHRFCRR
ncbi:Secreted protein OS=Streptomyces aurantiogriseus OX=66870 GN=GCM10010251_77380 PE=4 SV=1 [Streptomyces aurantiogriseus]